MNKMNYAFDVDALNNMPEITRIGTHNGVFHADDAFACAVLTALWPDVWIIRTRNPKDLASCQLRVDVGAKYNPATGDFDHHQGKILRENGIPYSSFGLIWKEYGWLFFPGCPEAAKEIEEGLVYQVDATDCGFSLFTPLTEEAKFPYSVSSVISSLNPGWNEGGDFDASFEQAVKLARQILWREISRAKGTLEAEGIVKDALAKREDKRVLILPQFCPWQEVVSSDPDVLYVLFPSETGDWRIQTVPEEPGSFKARKSLPAAWGAKRDMDLFFATGVEDAIFCHPGLFIAGCKSREGVLKMAEMAL